MVFRVKKTKNYTVMSNYHLQDRRLSLKAKGLLSLMLSLPDNWNYTARGLASICAEGYHTVRGVIGELEDNGYIVRRQKRGKSGVWSRAEYDIYEIPLEIAEENGEERETAAGTETPEASPTRTETPEASAPRPDAPELDAKRLNEYRKEIRENINYDWLWRKYGADIEILSGYVEIMAEVCAGEAPIKVRGQEIPPAEARRRLLSLDESHILYVMDSLKNTRQEVRNIRAYTLAALYNAPTTIDQYYKSKQSSDYWKLESESDD